METQVTNKRIQKEIGRLFLKILILIGIIVFLFTVIFGGSRANDNSMSPAIKSSDMILYYRLDNTYTLHDVVVVKYQGKQQIRRVVAVENDIVEINEDGLFVNGNKQYEPNITSETLPYVKGIEYPITLKEGEVFLLADKRENAVDSRVYGPVDKSDILGSVITVIRRRGI